MPKEKDRVRTVGFVIAITLLGKVMGLARDMLLGHNFGTGMAANAFSTASLIPRTFFDAVFASAISASFIPVFNLYLEQKGREEAFRLASAFMTLIALLTALISAAGMVFSGQITQLMAQFDEETARLCAQLLRILFPTVICTGAAFSMVGVLQSLGEFNIPAALSVVSNGVVLGYYLLFCRQYGIFGLAAAYLIGWALQAVMQLPALLRLGFAYRPALCHPGLRQIFLLVLPVMVGTWVQPINMLVTNRFASGLFDGAGATALQQANSLYLIVAGVFVLSITNVIFPELSRLNAKGQEEAFAGLLSSTLRAVLFLLLPMAAGLILLASPLVRLLYQWGAWTEFSTRITAGALQHLTLGMVGYGVQAVLSRAFYSRQKGLVPLAAGCVSIAANLALCLALLPVMDLRGLALASSGAMTVSALLMLVPLARQYPALLGRDFWRDCGRMLLCCAGMGAAVLPVLSGTLRWLPDSLTGRAVQVFLPALAGAAVYFALAWALGIPELRRGVKSLMRLRKRKERDEN